MKNEWKWIKQQVSSSEMTRKSVVGIFAALLSASAFANPQGASVQAGRISIQQSPGSTVINQQTQRGIINWQNFNINKGETTHFQQPKGGITLNRINPNDGVSQIFGNLTATGKIILINPAGIYFGPSAFVNVGGIIATTADISNRNFMKGNYQFTKVPGYSGSIVNEGRIVAADNGLVALVAPGVVNNGKIEARLGQVVLASGESFTMNFSGDGLINFAVTGQTKQRGVDKDGNSIADGVRNTGSLIADGGKIILTAQAASGVLDNAINMQGVAEARSVSQKNGEIIFSGDPESGVVRVAANVDASGRAAGEKGGTVQITGHDILVDSPSVIDVSGEAGGGDIYIGGNYKGAGPLPNSNATVVMPNTTLLADAITKGNGGNVILWSNDVTKAYGNISARGGAEGGNGGFIETSSHNYLDVAGIKVDTSAPKGEKGSWLLDPRNVFITTAATSGGSFDSGNPNIFTPTSDDSNVSNTDIMNNLASTDVDITTGSTGTQDGNISVDAPITWSSSNTLQLNAANKIFLNADITGTNGTFELSAANTAQSITSGTVASPSSTGVLANINVNNFRLLSGEWYQNNPNLPTFNAPNNFATVGNSTFSRFVGGNGGSSPYLITDKYGLQSIRTLSLFNNYQMVNNIDLSGTGGWNDGIGFQPLSPLSAFATTVYQGVFDGQNHAIINLSMTNTAGSDFGLFVNTSNPGIIENLTLINPVISEQPPFATSGGILIGANNGGPLGAGATVRNINIIGGSITTNTPFLNYGGLIGYNNGPVSNASSSATVIANSSNNNVGGLIGGNSTAVTNSASLGQVIVTGVQTSNNVGGFVGDNSVNISNSYSTALVSIASPAGNNVGGFAGHGSGTITNSFWDTDTSGQLSSPGGGTGISDTAMKTLSTFSNAGWSIGQAASSFVWNIVDSVTYPFLTAISSAVNIQTPSSMNLNLAIDGNVIGSGTTSGGSNNLITVVPINQNILAYNPAGTFTGDAIFSAPSSTFNTINISADQLLLDSPGSTLSNASLATTKGSLGTGINYTVSGNQLTLDPNVSFATNSGTTYNLDGNITTSGTGGIGFGGSAVTSTDVALTSENGDINFNQGITGGNNVSLTSSGTGNFNLSGPFSLQSMTVSGTGNNQLALATADNQAWRITGTNVGNVSNIAGINAFTFANINRLQGGSGNNSYTFSNQAQMGSIVGGTNANATNTLNLGSYQTPTSVILNSIFAGNSLSGNTSITDFSAINNLISNAGLSNSLTLPNKSNSVVITDALTGYINDPFTFSGVNTLLSRSGTDTISFPSGASLAPNSSNQVLINGTPMFFSNFNLDSLNVPDTTTTTSSSASSTTIASVMQQSTTTSSQQNDQQQAAAVQTTTITVTNNISDLMKDVSNLYDVKPDEIKINAHCGA